jgi:tetratricopeptide (TPR) repeat protein
MGLGGKGAAQATSADAQGITTEKTLRARRGHHKNASIFSNLENPIADFGKHIRECYTDPVSRALATTSAEEWLKRAMAARSAEARERYARQGLATRSPLDRTTQAMLLRQLYLAHFEQNDFELAREVAEQAIELDVLVDVLLQDAARAALAHGDLDGALTHLRGAARKAPASRRPFHLWTLGSVLFLAARYDEAARALSQAARWGTKDKPLYRGHLVLTHIAQGKRPDNLDEVFRELAEAPCGQGYGRFVLGHLAYAARQWSLAKRFLESFVRRTEAAPPLQAIALAGELEMARATLVKMSAN